MHPRQSLHHKILQRTVFVHLATQHTWPVQVQATAEVLSRPDVQSQSERFNFKQYMVDRAELVNGALDAAVPLQYPEAVVESMRYVEQV